MYLLVLEINGKRTGYKANLHACERFFKAMIIAHNEDAVQLVNVFKLV